MLATSPTALLRLVPVTLSPRTVAQAAQTLRVCWLRSRPSDGCLREKTNFANLVPSDAHTALFWFCRT